MVYKLAAEMRWRRIVRWLKCHDYRIVSVEHHRPGRERFVYRCVRCGHEVTYRNDAEAYSHQIVLRKEPRNLK